MGATEEALLAAFLGQGELLKATAPIVEMQAFYERNLVAIKRVAQARMHPHWTPDPSHSPDSPRAEHDIRIYAAISDLMISDANWRNPEIILKSYKRATNELGLVTQGSHPRSRLIAAMFLPTIQAGSVFTTALQNTASSGPGPIQEISAIFAKAAPIVETFPAFKIRYQIMLCACLGSLYAVNGDPQQAISLEAQALSSFFSLPLAYWDAICIPLMFIALQMLMRLDFPRYRAGLARLKASRHDSFVLANAIQRLEDLEEDLELIQSLDEAEKLLPPRPGHVASLESSDFMKKDSRHL